VELVFVFLFKEVEKFVENFTRKNANQKGVYSPSRKEEGRCPN